MFNVYVLFSDNYKRTYTGMTIDVAKRLREHNSNQNISTKAYAPWRVIFEKQYNTRIEARESEKYLKSGIGREFIKSLILSQNKRPRGATE
ncbi:MAG: GIY-YIG nuclease family protein [Gelidibacter sp.]|nr:GIY-YIG nuclease family protein [Gelidibacter sp.]